MPATLGELLLGSGAATTAAQAGLVALAPTSLPQGDQLTISQDASLFREGSNSLPASGQLYALVGNDLVMKYWSHNFSIDANGNFLGRDDPGPCSLFVITEGLGASASTFAMYSTNGVVSAGAPPGTFTKMWSIDLTNGAIVETPQSTGWGTPTGGAVSNNFAGASATLAQTSAAVAQIIAVLKAKGTLGV